MSAEHTGSRSTNETRFRARETLIEGFLASQSQDQSPEVIAKTEEGYKRLLGDIRRRSRNRAIYGPLPATLTPQTLRTQFIEFARENTYQTSQATSILALIYTYGLQDGVAKDSHEIGRLIHKSYRHLNIPQGQASFHRWIVAHSVPIPTQLL